MPATANRALPYPQGSDVPDVPFYMGQLADALDFDVEVIETMPRPPAGQLARAHHDPGTGLWSIDDGAGWATIATGGPFLPLTGGALSGALDLAGHELAGAIVTERRDKVTTVGAAGAARTLDAAVSPLHDVTLDQNVTFTFSGVDGDILVLVLRQPAAVKTVAWPATVDWEAGLTPAQKASSTVTYRFFRVAGRWRGQFSAATVDLFARKTADESVTSSTTLQNDDHLFVAVEANVVYDVELSLIVLSRVTENFKAAFTMPAAATFRGGLHRFGSGSPTQPASGTALTFVDGASVSVSQHINDNGQKMFFAVRGLLRTGANAGNLQLQWAQDTSGANTVTIYIDSFIRLTKLA